LTREHGLPGLVIFDCDGTLVDSSISNRLFYDGIKTRLGLPPMTVEEEAFSYVRPIAITLEKIIPGPLLSRAGEMVEATDWEDLAGQTRLQEGVAEFIGYMKKSGALTAINTNGSQEVHTILELLGVADLFDLVISADDVSRPKPDPEGVRLILARLGKEPGESVYIGDSIIDQLTAAGAGVEFWAFQAPDLTAVRHVDDYGELREGLASAL
jgi:phosphoglycolate phosphatase